MKPSQSRNNNELDLDHKDQEMAISQLPKSRSWLKSGLSKYQGFWFPTYIVPNSINFRSNFKPNDQDIILASKPKSDTTWLKALLFSVMNRTRFAPSNTPLLASNPHQLVPSFEYTLFDHGKNPDLTSLNKPRLFSTHIPYSSLPESIKSSISRMLYVSRNPLDAIVSLVHFASQDHPDRDPGIWTTMEDAVDAFCDEKDLYGPFWDHVLEFWKASQERPEKVLFLKYEDVKEDTELQVKKIAEFLGLPFSADEEERGVIREICELCSLGSLKEMGIKNKHEPGLKKLTTLTFIEKAKWAVGSMSLLHPWLSELRR